MCLMHKLTKMMDFSCPSRDGVIGYLPHKEEALASAPKILWNCTILMSVYRVHTRKCHHGVSNHPLMFFLIYMVNLIRVWEYIHKIGKSFIELFF